MSMQARQHLVSSPNTIFQDASQRADLLDPGRTQTQLIALLLELIGKGHVIEFTAVKSDHHDDHALGVHCHFDGYAADCWPLASKSAGDYLDGDSHGFRQFLVDVATSPWLFQIGLAGSADTEANRGAAGRTCFEDDGADHIHLGVIG